MAATRRPAAAVPLDGEVARAGARPQVADRRRHRSRVPGILALAGLVVGTLAADLVLMPMLGGSVVSAAWSTAALTESSSWWRAVQALHDPSLALVSVVLGGFPGAIAGHTVAVRRLRRDRIDGLVTPGRPISR